MRQYSERLHDRILATGTPALVGLDPRWDQLPAEIRTLAEQSSDGRFECQAAAFERFCLEIIDIVAPLVPAVKPQVAFFEQLGPAGIAALQRVMQYARQAGLVVIADAKRGDIGSTAEAYASAWLAGEDPDSSPFPSDALTVNAYLGEDTLQPFVDLCKQRGAGIYVLVRTSNSGAGVFQDRVSGDEKLFETVADVVDGLNQGHWPDSRYGGVGAVVGATWPQELSDLRGRMQKTPLLVPGYGSQGGTADSVAGAFDANGLGALINSSRAINFAYRKGPFAEEFGEEKWRQAIDAATRQMLVDLPAVTG